MGEVGQKRGEGGQATEGEGGTCEGGERGRGHM